MAIFSKFVGNQLPDEAPVSTADPMTLLDGIIGELERARADAIKIATTASAVEQAVLHAALSELESKLVMAREKREEMRARVARTERIRTLAAEMETLRVESAAALRGELDATRAARVKQRIEEIRDEAESLKQKSG